MSAKLNYSAPVQREYALESLSVAIAGNPNAGKTSLFNALTGLRQKVANYPGVTVETKMGSWPVAVDLPVATVVDLPGLYSLDATSIDEKIARDVLLGQTSKLARPDVVIVAVDATNLARNLYLATQLIDAGRPVVIALTMFDLAERNKLKIDIELLSRRLGVPVVPVVVRQRRGVRELGDAIRSIVLNRRSRLSAIPPNSPDAEENWQEAVFSRYRSVELLAGESIQQSTSGVLTVTERIDSIVTHRIFGPLVLFGIMLLVFQAIFSWASLPMDLIEGLFSRVGEVVQSNLPAGLVSDLLVNGVIAGVGGVLVFLPQILLLFFFISILEDSGYMARAAFLMDRVMRSFGLHGKSFMPLISSFACAVPGIMATRTIENPKDRLATILVAPFMSCSARLPVYTLMIATFFADRMVFGFISLGVVIMLGMYLLGIGVAVVVAWVLKKTMRNTPSPPFVMELPSYRLPDLGNVAHAIRSRIGVFVRRAGTVILAISIVLWALAAFPRRTVSPGATVSPAQQALDRGEQIRNSYAGRAGRLIEPAIRPLGFDWTIAIGLISSFAARETIISTLSIVYGAAGQSTSLTASIRNARRENGAPVWTPLVALSLMVFFVLACQCASTVAVVRRETNSWRWPLFMIAYMMALAYVASLITYQGGRLLGFS